MFETHSESTMACIAFCTVSVQGKLFYQAQPPCPSFLVGIKPKLVRSDTPYHSAMPFFENAYNVNASESSMYDIQGNQVNNPNSTNTFDNRRNFAHRMHDFSSNNYGSGGAYGAAHSGTINFGVDATDNQTSQATHVTPPREAATPHMPGPNGAQSPRDFSRSPRVSQSPDAADMTHRSDGDTSSVRGSTPSSAHPNTSSASSNTSSPNPQSPSFQSYAAPRSSICYPSIYDALVKIDAVKPEGRYLELEQKLKAVGVDYVDEILDLEARELAEASGIPVVKVAVLRRFAREQVEELSHK